MSDEVFRINLKIEIKLKIDVLVRFWSVIEFTLNAAELIKKQGYLK